MADSTICEPDKLCKDPDCEFDSDSTYFEVNGSSTTDFTEINDILDNGCKATFSEDNGKGEQEGSASKTTHDKNSLPGHTSCNAKVNSDSHTEDHSTAGSKYEFPLGRNIVRTKFDIQDMFIWLETVQKMYNKWIYEQQPLERHEAESILNNIKEEHMKCLEELVKSKNAGNEQVLEICKLCKAISKLEKNFQNEIALCDQKYTEQLEELNEQLDFSEFSTDSSNDSDELIENEPSNVLPVDSVAATKLIVDDYKIESGDVNSFKISASNKSTCSNATLSELNLPLTEGNGVIKDLKQFDCSEHNDFESKVEDQHKTGEKNSARFVTHSESEIKNTESDLLFGDFVHTNDNSTSYSGCIKDSSDFSTTSLVNITSRIIIHSNDITESEFRTMSMIELFQPMFDME